MPKRMTDTEKWKKPFLKSLPIEYKCFWFYVLDDCDHAGVWQIDTEVAGIRLGVNISIEKAQEYFKEKIVVFDAGKKWFIPDFITFQYGQLTEKNKMYNAVFTVLSKYNLMGHLSPLNGGKVQVQVKEQVTDEEQQLAKKEFLHQGIVPDMVADFKIKFPSYPIDKNKDYEPALWIAYAIGEQFGFKKEQVVNDRPVKVRKRWGELLDFIVTDKWYSTRSISDLKNEWQRLSQSFEKSGGKITISDGTNHREEKYKTFLKELDG